ncbi:podoplanin [Ochotona princeps]|uniref:podoplanin n=1 Tax=Ochotona princeps TaxID=9978 RepID=UPI0027152DBB|nr:podoplanin [Ochotona princeps]
MWKARLLLLLLGNAWPWVSAAAAAITPQPEDEIVSPGVEGGAVISGAEDYMVTAGASKDHFESNIFKDLVPTSADSVISRRIEDHSIPEGTVHSHKEIPKPTTPNVATSHPVEQADGETEKTTEKDGLTTVTLVGIIVGVLLGIGVIGGLVIAVARKMSGRYS